MRNPKRSKLIAAAIFATLLSLIFGSLPSIASPVPSPPPTNVTATQDFDNVTIAWEAPIHDPSVAISGYEYRVDPSFFSINVPSDRQASFLSSGGFYQGNAIESLTNPAQLSVTVKHLIPGGIADIGVRALYDDGGVSNWSQPSIRESVDQLFRVEQVRATIEANHPRIYSEINSIYLPTVTGVPGTYSVIYHSGGKVFKAAAIGDSQRGLSWQAVSACGVSVPTTVNVDVIYLTDQDKSTIASDGCAAEIANITEFSLRSVGHESFEYRTIPIPSETFRFEVTQPTDSVPVYCEETFYDGETPYWCSLTLDNGRDPNTFATFSQWVDVTNPDTPISVDTQFPPSRGRDYKAVWAPYAEPLDPLSVTIAGDVIETPGAATHLSWNVEDENLLPVSMRLATGTDWSLVLAPVDSRGNRLSENGELVIEGPYQEPEGSFDISQLAGCADSLAPPGCPKYLKLTLTTHRGSDSKSFQFYILRDSTTDVSLTYSMPVNPDSVGPSQPYVSAPRTSAIARWWAIEPAEEFYSYENYSDLPHSRFAGWCASPNPSSFQECYHSGDFIPVTSHITLYALWVSDTSPVSIRFGTRTITPDNSVEWLVDRQNSRVYVTVESSSADPLSGAVSMEGPMGINFSPGLYWAEDQRGNPVFPQGERGEYSFDTGCSDFGGCPAVYYLGNDFAADTQGQLPIYSGTWGVYVIVKPAADETFTVSYDVGNGTTLPGQQLSVGWHENPGGAFTRQGYYSPIAWRDSVTGTWSWWDNFYPVLANETVSVIWMPGPEVDSYETRTIALGATEVGTASAIYQGDGPVTWSIIDTTDFSISTEGLITARADLPVGVYTFEISATHNIEGPRFRMTVTVEAPAASSPQGAGGGGGSSAPPVVAAPTPNPTDKPVEVKPAPKPELLRQPDASASVGRSHLGVGATTKVAVRGGLANGVVKYSTSNSKVCLVDPRGSVTAKSEGTCLINAQVLTADPAYAPAVVGPIRITVLGQGLVDSATLKVKNGNVTVVASLLKKNAGKRASLFQVRQVAGKSVLISRGWVRLDRNAVATFSSFKQGKTPAKLVVMVDGMKVYELASK
jgi:hypothetical protein